MPRKLKLALIVAQPSPLRDALRALVTTMPQIEIVAETGSITALTEMYTQFRPDLVVLDANLQDDGLWQALAAIKGEGSPTRSCVLVEGEDQQRQAETSGADLVLHKGLPAADLVETLEELLTQIDNEG